MSLFSDLHTNKHTNADKPSSGGECDDVQDVVTIFNLRQVLPVDFEQISKETKNTYPELSKVIQYLHKDMGKKGDTSFTALSQ